MIPAKRRATILAHVQRTGIASVKDLSQNLGVSPTTIRRDLTTLERGGELQRVRGGGRIEHDDHPFAHVAHVASQDKQRIAAVANEMIEDKSVVLLDIGTTTAAIANAIQHRVITVVTASLAVVDILKDSQTVELICLGGVLRHSYYSFVGNLTEYAINQLTADIAFIGTSGIQPDGTVLDSTGIEVPIKQAIIARSHHSVLVAAQDKFPGSGLLRVCDPGDIHTLITTQQHDHPTLDVMASAGTEVRIA